MTLERLQEEMIKAMKLGLTHRKTTISSLIAQIKTAAINEGCRNNITEDFVNKQILKAKKQAQESIDGAKAANRPHLVRDYEDQYKIIDSFAPQLISDENEIRNILNTYDGDKTKSSIMKWVKATYGSRMDMRVASKVVSEVFRV